MSGILFLILLAASPDDGVAELIRQLGDDAAATRDAGVAKLVLTHLVPAPNNLIARRLFRAGVSDVYEGPVVIAEDGMRISLAPR